MATEESELVGIGILEPGESGDSAVNPVFCLKAQRRKRESHTLATLTEPILAVIAD